MDRDPLQRSGDNDLKARKRPGGSPLLRTDGVGPGGVNNYEPLPAPEIW